MMGRIDELSEMLRQVEGSVKRYDYSGYNAPGYVNSSYTLQEGFLPRGLKPYDSNPGPASTNWRQRTISDDLYPILNRPETTGGKPSNPMPGYEAKYVN